MRPAPKFGLQGYLAHKRQPRDKLIVSLVNSHTNAARIRWHLWEIDLRFAPGLPQGWKNPFSCTQPPSAYS